MAGSAVDTIVVVVGITEVEVFTDLGVVAEVTIDFNKCIEHYNR